MRRLLLKSAALMIVLFIILMSATMSVARLQGQQRLDEIRAFLLEGECALPCFMGISPDQTSYQEVMDVLSQNPAVDNISVTRTPNGTTINWDWSNATPSWIDKDTLGEFGFWSEDNSLPWYAIKTHIRIHEFYLLFGDTNYGISLFDNNNMLHYSMEYPFIHFWLSVDLACPVSLIDYWNAKAEISYWFVIGGDAFVEPQQMVNLC